MTELYYESEAKHANKALARTIGFAFYWRRHRLGLTLKQVSYKAELSSNQIDRFEMGKGGVNVMVAFKLMSVYKWVPPFEKYQALLRKRKAING